MASDSRWFRFAAILAVAVCLVVQPWIIQAQPAKVYRVGTLGNDDSPPWRSFRQGLRQLGYIEGRNLVIESRWSGGFTDRLPALAPELVRQNVDVIVASGNQAVHAARQATSSIPIVMAVSGYPDRQGLVQSLARPGGNVTGLSNVAPQLQLKRLELLKEIAPKVSRVAWLWNPASPFESDGVEEWRASARALGLTLNFVPVRSPDDFPAAFSAVLAGKADALMAYGNPVSYHGRQAIADFALKHGLAGMFEERLFVEAGGLASYAPSFIDLFRRAATFVDEILKGAKPADLPVEQPQQFELVINLKTARALGLTIPPSVLLRADHVIE